MRLRVLFFVAIATPATFAAACTLVTSLDDLTSDAVADEGGVDAGADVHVCPDGAVFTSDPLNCGACGHDCFGGLCAAGSCQAVLLASGLQSVSYLRVDATHVYFLDTTAATVLRVRKEGGLLEQLAAGQGGLYSLEVDDAYVYFSSPPGLRRVPKAGGEVATIISAAEATETAIVGNDLYWTVYGEKVPGAIHHARGDGTSDQVLAMGVVGVESIAVRGDDVFFGENALLGKPGSVKRVPRAGGAVVTLASSPARRIAVDDANVYWVGYDSSVVQAVSRDGGARAVTLATSPANVRAGDIAVDDTNVYWTVDRDDAGVVLRAPKTGGPVTEIAVSGSGAVGVAVDERAVYYSFSEGAVYKRAK